jgi:hypothetical protein
MTDREAFLQHVFATVVGGETAAIARQIKGGACPVDPWPKKPVRSNHTHFSVGVVEYPQPKQFRRRNAFWTGSVGLVLDDVFEKAAPPELVPTYRMETKPGSEQWCYLFETMMRNASEFETLVNSCIMAGLGDPGAKGRVRLARLPGSMPPGKTASAVLLEANWERRFPASAKWFTDRLNIPLQLARVYTQPVPATGWEPTSDPLLQWLQDNGWIIGSPMGTWHPLHCPWADTHTGGDLSGSRYHSPEQNDIRRAFTCHHGHCVDRRFDDFARYFLDSGAPTVDETTSMMEQMGSIDAFAKTLTPEQLAEMQRLFGWVN